MLRVLRQDRLRLNELAEKDGQRVAVTVPIGRKLSESAL
jgi:hypothetical protein